MYKFRIKQVHFKNRTDTRKLQRAEPQQLQQEDSDAVWNELAYFKRENQELMIQK